eukprot:337521-Chlamydomonas_euryale.AAC.1
MTASSRMLGHSAWWQEPCLLNVHAAPPGADLYVPAQLGRHSREVGLVRPLPRSAAVRSYGLCVWGGVPPLG